MKKKRLIVLVLATVSISWRLITLMSFDNLGYIGFTENEVGIITSISSGSPADVAGFMVGDEVLSRDSLEPNKRPRPNQRIRFTIKRNENQQVILLKTSKYVATKIMGILGILTLFIGLFSFYRNQNNLSFIFFLYCFVMSIHWGGYPQLTSAYSHELISQFYILISIFLGSIILHFGMIYPKDTPLSVTKYWIIYFPGIVGVILFSTTLFGLGLNSFFKLIEPILVALFSLAGGIALFRTYFVTPKESRNLIGINVICWGILLANLPYIFSTILPFMDFGGRFGALFYRILFIFQPISFAIGIERFYRFNDLSTNNQ